MKRKNLFFVSALILFGLANVNSAMAQPQSDDATVNIKFRPVQSIVVNPAQKSVDLLYATKDNYANGVTAERPDHLEVFSTGGFTVTANTGGDFTRTDGGTIDADDVTVRAAGTSTNTGSFTDVVLSIDPQTLITANEGGTALMYNVTYDNTAGGGNVYINNYIHPDSPESVYTATVTYTIATN